MRVRMKRGRMTRIKRRKKRMRTRRKRIRMKKRRLQSACVECVASLRYSCPKQLPKMLIKTNTLTPHVNKIK